MVKDNDVKTDTTYNNRPQAEFEAGTKAFAPLIETNTGMVVSMTTANKLCRKNSRNHEACMKTQNTEQSIASSERILANRNLEELKEGNIVTVTSVTSDASAQLDKTVKDFSTRNKQDVTHYF